MEKIQANHQKLKIQDSRINIKAELNGNYSRSLILVEDDIITAEVDAIVNSTNLLFSEDYLIKGIPKRIIDLAGEEYLKPCLKHGELRETRVFTCDSGKLINCKSIINVCLPYYKRGDDILILEKIKRVIQNILKEANHWDFETLAIPFIGYGNYDIPDSDVISCIFEEILHEFCNDSSSLKHIFVYTIGKEQLEIVQKEMELRGKDGTSYEKKHQPDLLISQSDHRVMSANSSPLKMDQVFIDESVCSRQKDNNKLLREMDSQFNGENPNEGFSTTILDLDDPRYTEVVSKFTENMDPNRFKSIKYIQNIQLLQDFFNEKDSIGNIHSHQGHSSEVKEESCWYGNKTMDPSQFLKTKCFNSETFQSGLWGKGHYFSKSANYADKNAFVTPSNRRVLLYCKVLIGETIDMKRDETLTKPPKRGSGKKKICYDSVRGVDEDSEVYIIYRPGRAYPEYLIEYE